MKNYIAAIAGSLITSCAFASPFAGTYVTGALGGISTDFQIKGNATVSVTNAGNVYNTPNNSNVYANSILGSLGLGYAYPYTYASHNFIVGIQGDANFFNADQSQSVSFSEAGLISLNSNIKAQLKNSYDILFRPGWLMDPATLLYGLLGASFGDFKVSQSANFQEHVGPINLNKSASSGRSLWRTGFTLGVGVQRYFWNNISAALEYSYTDYGNISLTNNASTPLLVDGNVPIVAAVNGNVNQVKVFTNTVSLRVFYNFL